MGRVLSFNIPRQRPNPDLCQQGTADDFLELIQTELAESRVMANRGLASGGARVARDRKDVNARSFRKNKPVNDGKRAGKAEPVA